MTFWAGFKPSSRQALKTNFLSFWFSSKKFKEVPHRKDHPGLGIKWGRRWFERHRLLYVLNALALCTKTRAGALVRSRNVGPTAAQEASLHGMVNFWNPLTILVLLLYTHLLGHHHQLVIVRLQFEKKMSCCDRSERYCLFVFPPIYITLVALY